MLAGAMRRRGEGAGREKSDSPRGGGGAQSGERAEAIRAVVNVVVVVVMWEESDVDGIAWPGARAERQRVSRAWAWSASRAPSGHGTGGVRVFWADWSVHSSPIIAIVNKTPWKHLISLSMPPPVRYSPANIQAIHLFRALLREASYLPDSQARHCFHHHIVGRFKAYQPARNATINLKALLGTPGSQNATGHKRRSASVIKERTPALLKKGRKALNYLRRANQGEIQCLERVLLATYGRIGRRKYALMQKLLQPDSPPEDDQVGEPALSPLQRAYHSKLRVLSYFDAPQESSTAQENLSEIQLLDKYPRLKVAIQTQAQINAGISGPRLTRKAAVQLPTRNVWQRPLPIKRARNRVKKWWRETLTRLLPPLPEEEWKKLQGLSTGTLKWEGIVPRRTPGIDRPTTIFRERVPEKFSQQLSAKIIQDGLWIKKPSIADRPLGTASRDRPHALTPRFMQRLYGRIFVSCNMLEWNEQKSQWSVRWGSVERSFPASPAVDPLLFAGVDKRGKLLRERKTSTTANS